MIKPPDQRRFVCFGRLPVQLPSRPLRDGVLVLRVRRLGTPRITSGPLAKTTDGRWVMGELGRKLQQAKSYTSSALLMERIMLLRGFFFPFLLISKFNTGADLIEIICSVLDGCWSRRSCFRVRVSMATKSSAANGPLKMGGHRIRAFVTL